MNDMLGAALWLGMSAMAAEHRVEIGPGLVYTPASLTIRVGDSVRFSASDVHPLTADDGRFRCFADCVVVYDRPGTHGFHCDTHGGPGVRMAGAVHVTANGSTLPATPAFDGLWYDPAASGQGLALQVLPGTAQVALGWFTWSDAGDGRHDWLTGIGRIEGDLATLELARDVAVLRLRHRLVAIHPRRHSSQRHALAAPARARARGVHRWQCRDD